jgi:hypothetical protein
MDDDLFKYTEKNRILNILLFIHDGKSIIFITFATFYIIQQ